MPREDALRRPRFSPGIAVRLADGQSWVVPPPGCPATGGAEYDSLLASLDESEDEAGRRQAELALAIFLLDFNYQLSPADFAAILDCPPGGDRLARLQEALREVATAHASHARMGPASRPMGSVPWRGSLRSRFAYPID